MRTKSHAISTIGFVSALLLCVLVTSGATYAQRNRWDSYPNWGGSYELRQTALNAGYNEGSKAGREDRSRGRRSDYSSFSVYRNANKDYNGRYGDRELYQRYFRAAFENGYDTEMGIQRNARYNDRYDRNRDRDRDWNDNRDRNDRGRDHRGRDWTRYGNYGGSYDLRQTALNAGYNEGIKQGHNDRSHNRRYDFSGQGAYQKATTDYSSHLGDRELYRRYYREGYENGYSDGYNGY
jgi:hypothetical protein